jgi:hypothetical protein
MKIMIVMKMEFYQAIGYYCHGLDREENSEYGEAVGIFRQAKQSLINSAKQSEKMSSEAKSDVGNSLMYARDVIEGKLTSGENCRKIGLFSKLYNVFIKKSR